jgi:hypothetical protein
MGMYVEIGLRRGEHMSQNDDSGRVDAGAVVRESEETKAVIVFTVDVGNGEEAFCVIDFVDIEEGVYAITTPEEQYDNEELLEWDLYPFRYDVTDDGDIELSAVDDEELCDRVIQEYERLGFQEGLYDLGANPFLPEPSDA